MIHSFLLIGQSNMAGRGFIDEATEIDSSNIHVLRMGRWRSFYRPVNCDRPFSGVCLAESFAEKYAKEHSVQVGLIPCADGGTTLYQWAPGGLLYEHAVCQAKIAARTSNIVGVLWHQGEGDCCTEGIASYKKKFEELMRSLREDLDLHDVPFILGGMGDYLKDCPLNPNFVLYDGINDELKKIAADNPYTGFASAEGLTPNPDISHFSSKALYEFGLRYYDEFKKLENKNKVYPEKPSEEVLLQTELEKL